MRISEVVELIAKENPNFFTGIPRGKANALARMLFTCIVKTIEETHEGIVKFGGLGTFNVRSIEREVAGERITKKVVTFRAAKQKKKENE